MNSPRRIRVLMVTATLGYGGAESAFIRLANFLSRHADVTIALMAQDYGRTDYSNQQSSTTHPVVLLDESGGARAGLIGKLRRWRRMQIRLRSLKTEHDVAISFLSGPNLLNAFAGTPKATIISERGSKLYHTGIPPLRKYMWLRIFDPITYQRVAKIVTASVGYTKEIAQIAGKRHMDKIVSIEGGIDANSLIASSEEVPDPDIVQFCSGPTAVYCGRMDHGKGIDLLLPSFARVRARLPGARLLLIGDGPLGQKIVDDCHSLGLPVTKNGDPSAAVFMAGYRSDPIRHFRLCELFLFPSLHEGLGNALIEGVASGIAVLSSDCRWGPRSVLSGQDDIVKEDTVEEPTQLVNGMLMPLPTTVTALKMWDKQMGFLLENPKRRKSPDVSRQAIDRFDINVTGLHWNDLIYQVAGAPTESKE